MWKEYEKLIDNNDLIGLANIKCTTDLIHYEYKDRKLLEYLLENNIHNEKINEVLIYDIEFAKLYLKYNRIEPLIQCSLANVLLKNYNDDLFLDVLLKKLDDNYKLKLYDNIRYKNYNNYRLNEALILDSFKKNGIVLPTIFVNQPIDYSQYTIRIEDISLIERLIETFSDHERIVLDIFLNEIKKRLLINHERTVIDVEKIIEYKKNHPNFSILLTREINGHYFEKHDILEISYYSSIIFDHELSHLLFLRFENMNVPANYEIIRRKIDSKENIDKFIWHLKLFHQNYQKKMKENEREYYNIIKERYGSFDNYLMVICQDFYSNKDKIKFIIMNNKLWDFMHRNTYEKIQPIVLEFLEREKNEFIVAKTKKYYEEYLIFENMLDSLVLGKLFDAKNGGCLSGHSTSYFIREFDSFNECIANFDAIYKSRQREGILKELAMLVDEELIELLEKYLENNREKKYVKR